MSEWISGMFLFLAGALLLSCATQRPSKDSGASGEVLLLPNLEAVGHCRVLTEPAALLTPQSPGAPYVRLLSVYADTADGRIVGMTLRYEYKERAFDSLAAMLTKRYGAPRYSSIHSPIGGLIGWRLMKHNVAVQLSADPTQAEESDRFMIIVLPIHKPATKESLPSPDFCKILQRVAGDPQPTTKPSSP